VALLSFPTLVRADLGCAQGKEAELNSRNRRGAGHNRRDRSSDHKEWFTCRGCGMTVVCTGAGTEHRNHCPNCLHSVHLDIEPGDREADCGAVMEPISVWVRKGGEWAIIHRCRKCGALSSNRIAADDNNLLLMSLAVRPLSSPPFPLEHLTSPLALS